MEGVIEIDGSLYEGGGQIIRLSLALAIICNKSVFIYNIRAGRPNPGLAESHLVSLNLLGSMSSARIEGNFKGSTSIRFSPGQFKPGNYKAICNTAGSTNLILQAALPVLIRSDSTLTITGGTDTDFSPPSLYITEVLMPALNQIGVNCQIQVDKYGFYPKGNGKISVTTRQSTPRHLNLDPGSVEYLGYEASIIITENIKNHPQTSAILREVKEEMKLAEDQVKVKTFKAMDKAVVVCVYCKTSFVPIFHSFIENFKKSSYDVRQICRELKAEVEHNHSVDTYLQDQILVYLAMASEPSSLYTTRITPHTEGVIWLLNLFNLARVSYSESFIRVLPVN